MPDVRRRIGTLEGGNGAADIKAHPFFRGLDFEALRTKRLQVIYLIRRSSISAGHVVRSRRAWDTLALALVVVTLTRCPCPSSWVLSNPLCTPAPWCPELRDALDTSHFDEYPDSDEDEPVLAPPSAYRDGVIGWDENF